MLFASKFRTRVGESLVTVEKHETPLAEATIPSLEALKAYSMAWKVVASEGGNAAVPFFKHAVEIDPRFATAYASLGLMYGSMALASRQPLRAQHAPQRRPALHRDGQPDLWPYHRRPYHRPDIAHQPGWHEDQKHALWRHRSACESNFASSRRWSHVRCPRVQR